MKKTKTNNNMCIYFIQRKENNSSSDRFFRRAPILQNEKGKITRREKEISFLFVFQTRV